MSVHRLLNWMRIWYPLSCDIVSEEQSLQNTISLLQETLSDARKEGWFEGYDWVFCMNPDVIVRNDSFILDVMQTDSNAAVLIKCSGYAHTNFFAIKPKGIRLISDHIVA